MNEVDIEVCHLRKLAASLYSLREDVSLTDVTLVCGQQEFHAHRLVLCAASHFFQSTCCLEWSGSQRCKIDLPAVSPDCMEVILTFIYTGKIAVVTKNKDAIARVLQASSFLEIDDLVEILFRVLAELHLTATNFQEICKLAEQISNPLYLTRTETFLSRNFKEMATSNDFLYLSCKQLKRILNHPELNPKHIDDAIMSVLRWVEFDKDRKEFLRDLIDNLDLSYLSRDRLSHLLQRNAIVKSNTEVIEILSSTVSARKFKTDPSHSPDKINDEIVNFVKSEHQNLLCFGEVFDRHVLRIYDVESGEWLPTKYLPFHLSRCMAAVNYGCYTYFFGGREAGSELPITSVIKYCYRTNSSTSSAGSLISPVYQAGAGVLNGSIYIVNGLGKEKFVMKTVQCYNPRDGTCRTLASTREGHNRPYVFAFNGYLYVVGSDNDEDYRYNDEMCVERYDPARGQWTIVTRVPGSTDWCSAVLCGTKLFVVRNVQETLFQVCDMHSGEWHVREFLWDEGPTRVDGLLSARRRGKPLLFVEHNGVLHSYDVECGEWDKTEKDCSDTWHIFQTCTI